jgi:hypothetical protein
MVGHIFSSVCFFSRRAPVAEARFGDRVPGSNGSSRGGRCRRKQCEGVSALGESRLSRIARSIVEGDGCVM